MKRNALLSSANLSWGTLAIAFSLCVLLVRLLAPNLFLQVFAPAFRAATFIDATSRTFFAGFNDTVELAARNEQLTYENAALAIENQALLEKEASVDALLGASASSRDSGILAGVVARPPESPYDTLVLATGKDASVVLGMEVFGAGGVPLGVVSSVTADFSRVTLFSAPGVVVQGWVGKESVPLTIIGTGGGTLNATLARSAPVVVGDTVFAPGPGLLPIGNVVRIDNDPSASEVTLRIMPAVNPFSLTWVLVRDTGAAFRESFSLASSTAL